MPETLPQYLAMHAERTPDKVALRERIYGIWQPVTWKQYYDHVKYFALGLHALGLEPEDTVAIIGDNRPEWLFAELAAQSMGAKSVGIYQDSVSEEVLDIVSRSDATFVVAEDQEQVDKLIEIWPQLGALHFAQGRLVHPHGEIYVKFQREKRGLQVEIRLPAKINGILRWHDRRYPLTAAFSKHLLPLAMGGQKREDERPNHD